MKLFELPIYALSRETIKKRVENKKQSILNELPNDDRKGIEEISKLLDNHFFPHRVWDYNHIIGYLFLCIEKSDFQFNLYLPINTVKGKQFRYYWHSKTRIFLSDVGNPYIYFCIFHMNGVELKNNICNRLNEIKKDIKKHNWYLDTEAFDNVTPYIDFDKLCELGI